VPDILIGAAVPDVDTGIFTEAEGADSGGRGNITLNLDNGRLDVSNGAAISADARGEKQAGSIQINADQIHLAGTNSLADEGDNSRAGISATSERSSVGSAGGNITLDADTLVQMSNGAQLVASSAGTGAAGTISIASPELNINEGSVVLNENTASSAVANDQSVTSAADTIETAAPEQIIGPVFSEDTSTANNGFEGGSIELTADTFFLRNGSLISSQSNLGDSGDITVSGSNAGNLIVLDRGIIVSTSNGESPSARAGDISLLSGGNGDTPTARLFLDQAFIQANASSGNGGDIIINTDITVSRNGVNVQGERLEQPDFMEIFRDIVAGEITLQDAPILPNVIQAASEGGTQGTLTLTAPQFDVSAIVSKLDSDFVDVENLAGNPCAASVVGAPSTLSVSGSGGLPITDAPLGLTDELLSLLGDLTGVPAKGIALQYDTAVMVASSNCVGVH